MIKTNVLYLLAILVLIVMGPSLANQPPASVKKIHCLHPQTCNLLQSLIKENKKDQITVQEISGPTGDHHHFEPSLKQFKKLAQVEYLILPPQELFPWVKKIKPLRKKGTKTYFLTLEAPLERTKNHFWLYPKTCCQLHEKLKSKLIEWKIITDIHAKKTYCPLNQLSLELPKSPKKPIIVLTHNALEPFFKENGLKTLVLEDHGHHQHQTKIQVMKELHNLSQQKETPLIWIIETNIYTQNTKWKKYIKKHHQIIKINLKGSFPSSPSETLEKLLGPLKKILLHP